MAVIVTVAYPRPSGEVNFNLKYYLDSHMPLVTKTWGTEGLTAWSVTELWEGPYIILAALHWESSAAFDTAAASEGGAGVFGDVPNFTDIEPILLKGDVKGSWSA